ncbi:MAG: hypothetical protein PVI07_18030 [Anaerolineae bacterium]
MAWPIPCFEAAFSVERSQQAIGFLFAEGELAVPAFAKAQSVPLLHTRLCIPPARRGLVSRPLLVAQLNQGVRSGHKLILVSALSGFGKTTLVNEWVHQVDAPVGCPPCTIVVVSICLGADNPQKQLSLPISWHE